MVFSCIHGVGWLRLLSSRRSAVDLVAFRAPVRPVNARVGSALAGERVAQQGCQLPSPSDGEFMVTSTATNRQYPQEDPTDSKATVHPSTLRRRLQTGDGVCTDFKDGCVLKTEGLCRVKCTAEQRCAQQCVLATCGAGREVVPFKDGKTNPCWGCTCGGDDVGICCKSSCSLFQGCDANQALNKDELCASATCGVMDKGTCCSPKDSCASPSVWCSGGKFKDLSTLCEGIRCSAKDFATCCAPAVPCRDEGSLNTDAACLAKAGEVGWARAALWACGLRACGVAGVRRADCCFQPSRKPSRGMAASSHAARPY